MPTTHSTVKPWLEHSQQQALDVWDQFETEANRQVPAGSPPRVEPASLLEPSNGWRPNAAIEGLFKYSALRHPSVVMATLVIGSLQQHCQNRPVGRAAAWLAVRRNRWNQLEVFVMLDWPYLDANYGRALADTVRAVNHLVLHETGHVVMHWRDLTDPQHSPQQGLVPDMAARAEAEAWGFCGAILSMAYSRIAYETKLNPQADARQAWEWLFPHPRGHYTPPVKS